MKSHGIMGVVVFNVKQPPLMIKIERNLNIYMDQAVKSTSLFSVIKH